jgi:hypothetical protein
MPKEKISKKKSTVSKKKAAKKKVSKKKVTTKKVAKKKATKKTATSIKAKPVKPMPDKSKQTKLSPEDREQMIAVAAYYRWEQSGCITELEIDHWLLAEQDIDELMK